MGLGALRLCDSYAIARALPSKTYSRARIVAPRLTSLDSRRKSAARGVRLMRENATEPESKLLRAWQLAVLRFAVTLDDDDRMHALGVAGEVDRLGGAADDAFHFFRRTTAELCAAISGQSVDQEAVIRRFLAQIDNVRLKRAVEAAIANDRTPPKLVASRVKPGPDLWRGLAPRRATGT
ncbi:hypothetical protein ABIF38_002716 [Bradyrhizobium japonicum]|uniref:Uncharacterized protein n=2 Tax=Bradyrhizobium elkanii TaxID=29448 RepID=A0ABV4FC98_BRAEL|nr:hypothetical protein [Bradyrhizobium elkanii]MBP2431955.1 hypothetical protein [Bradyrhizobium elkanii]MCP1734970.1 hypothetical protein [Bradyrhizobium elkanii]MCP1752516.1 hypothetical protein [Bradyrhizobium elkanii]MCP1978289.1 hypothetical protein [Bradyrhizobium elkanii]MCS3570309.1 hypothetical protein [Bradyrhizobium elkanii]